MLLAIREHHAEQKRNKEWGKIHDQPSAMHMGFEDKDEGEEDLVEEK